SLFLSLFSVSFCRSFLLGSFFRLAGNSFIALKKTSLSTQNSRLRMFFDLKAKLKTIQTSEVIKGAFYFLDMPGTHMRVDFRCL
ncbi:MAG TPA: hypothetical protein PLI34_03970, partial [Saprospiraceae bacterium]|nr:hypothetical protein [Saprospiraceae bacterium]